MKKNLMILVLLFCSTLFADTGEQVIDKVIKDGMRIYMPLGAGSSAETFKLIFKKAESFKEGITIVTNVASADYESGKDLYASGKVKLESHYIGARERKLASQGYIHYLPGHFSVIAHWYEEALTKKYKPDVIVLRVSPKLKNGKHSLGFVCEFAPEILFQNPIVIAELDDNIPLVDGCLIDPKNIDYKFSSTSALFQFSPSASGPIENKIAENIAALISEDATLQLGIGSSLVGFAQALNSRPKMNLSIWSELLSDHLYDIGRKHHLKSVTTALALGTQELYSNLAKNKNFKLAPLSKTNNPGTIAKIKKFHAINTGLQVTLAGDVNATHLMEGRISAPGGQVDFFSGAIKSPGGKSIIALRSTVKDDAISTIVLNNYHGIVTTPGEFISHVVTEYGVAEIAGKSEKERALAIISVAHPKFRDDLTKQLEASLKGR